MPPGALKLPTASKRASSIPKNSRYPNADKPEAEPLNGQGAKVTWKSAVPDLTPKTLYCPSRLRRKNFLPFLEEFDP
jgi:hypothetical protein